MTYEFRCSRCGHGLKSLHSKYRSRCPLCGSEVFLCVEKEPIPDKRLQRLDEAMTIARARNDIIETNNIFRRMLKLIHGEG